MELICTDRNGFRRVNDREADALKYTFGVSVGSFLIGIINIEYDPTLAKISKKGRVRTDREIQMRSDYDPENLRWLGVFIHEAVHIWQRETDRHQEGTGGEDYIYNYTQLPTLKLKIEEHAKAVQDWFYVNYGIESGLIGRTNQIDSEWVWRQILKAFGFDWDDSADVRLGLDELQRLVKRWTPVIEEIRDPQYLPE
jgi:hypothetical protein